MDIISTRPKANISTVSAQNITSLWQDEPMKIVVMLFDKSLLHIGRARSTLLGWDDESYQTHILHAVDVIESLQMTLCHKTNSSMATNLDDVYRYVMSLLISSIQQKNVEKLNEATSLLIQIRESLAILVKKTPKMSQH